jgi:pyridinium-3,5-bisthiocarboxylic acid mononucleotide nickel chelatase
MLLGTLHALGVLEELPALLDSLGELGVAAAPSAVTRHGLTAVGFDVSAAGAQPVRNLADVLTIIDRATAPAEVKARAAQVFRHLAEVEAAVHGTTTTEVHFHEVGAVDSIVDVLGACLGLATLALDQLVVSPIALGGGTVSAAHGSLPVPTPAATALLTGTALVAHGGPVDVELATPTGIAVLTEWATSSGPMPPMTVTSVGVGAGGRELEDRANVLRLVVGEMNDRTSEAGWQTIEANVDDLDPRLWPGILDHLLAAGAADAWLTPILMKKGRPAHTLSALVGPDALDAVRQVFLRETSTIGMRLSAVGKHALDRSWVTVDIDGQKVRVKLAYDGPTLMNLSPEFDDVTAVAETLGLPTKTVLARASAAAMEQL